MVNWRVTKIATPGCFGSKTCWVKLIYSHIMILTTSTKCCNNSWKVSWLKLKAVCPFEWKLLTTSTVNNKLFLQDMQPKQIKFWKLKKSIMWSSLSETDWSFTNWIFILVHAHIPTHVMQRRFVGRKPNFTDVLQQRRTNSSLWM